MQSYRSYTCLKKRQFYTSKTLVESFVFTEQELNKIVNFLQDCKQGKVLATKRKNEMKKLLSILFTFSVVWAMAQASTTNYSSLLQKHVTSTGKVNYKTLKTDISKLNTFLSELKENAPKSSWSKNEIKAYWINAYNAFTLKLMLNNYPVKSITDIKYGDKNAWDYTWINIGGEKLSLNDIEHKKLRAKYKDARIHFAVNCASYSCPILLNTAYTAKNLETQLNAQAKKFINDSSRNKISADKVQISEIFKWYKDDFTTSGSIIDYLNKYSTVKIKSTASVTYLNYNWNINE